MADGSPRLVKETSKVSLLMPDGREAQGKKKDIDNKIEEIIGLDVNQFTQIAMIAQGDFLRLLHAESKERKKIFSRIFQTRLYWQVQEELKEEAKQLYIRMEDNTKDCQWERLLALKLPPAEEVMDVLKGICRYGKSMETEAEKEHTQLQKKAEDLNAAIRSQEEVNILLQSKEQAQKRLKELEEKKSKMEELRRQIKDGERAEKVLVKEEQYKRTSVEAKRLKEVAVLEVREKELQQLEKELQEKEPVLQKQILRLKDILPKYAGIRKLEEQYNKQLKKMEHVLEECRTASADYERKYQEFFEEQAGILAKELKEGQPCPVCGSTEHPHKAELLKSAPVQEEVQQAKEKRDQKEQERSDCQEQFQASKSRLDSERKLLEQAAEDIMAGGSLQEEEAKEHLEHLEADLKEMKKNFQKKEKEFRELMEEMKRRSGLLESQEKQLQELNTKQKEEEEYFQEELKAQKFATREEYSRALEWTEGRRAKADALSEYEKECLEVKTRYEMLCQQSEGKQHADLEEEKEKLEEVLLSQKAQKDRWLHLHSQNQKNKEARSKLKQYFETKAGLTKQYEMVNNLSRTANGTLNGSIKLDFETYVQRKYFKQIIHAANRRLSKMTSNEFILQCREIKDLSSQGQAGLDLDVYHLVNDAVRDVKTLSGGESFMASLSMALGLSDIIQNTAGAISLETMFVDEGFGSLDDAARERAIQILQELAGEKGTVGIISHVNELKEQIEWKLAVTKTEQGSSTRWVLE